MEFFERGWESERRHILQKSCIVADACIGGVMWCDRRRTRQWARCLRACCKVMRRHGTCASRLEKQESERECVDEDEGQNEGYLLI